MKKYLGPLEEPAFVCSHVFRKEAPALLVSRADGDWQFLCGGQHDANEKPHVIGLNHLFEDDPTLCAIKGLPVNWEAERDAVGNPWIKRGRLG